MLRALVRLASISRRSFLVGSTGLVLSDQAAAARMDPFSTWERERAALEAELDRTPEATMREFREQLLGRLYETEQLILETPSSELNAMRAKASVLTWLMEMEQADGQSAMRHIRDFLEGLA